jgi:hypothetical protein
MDILDPHGFERVQQTHELRIDGGKEEVVPVAECALNAWFAIQGLDSPLLTEAGVDALIS